MFYRFQMTSFLEVEKIVSVIRNTVWHIAERKDLLIYMEDGCCEFAFDDETFTARPGDLIFIPADHTYTRRPIDNALCTMTYLHFTLPQRAVMEDAKSMLDIAIGLQNKLNDLALRGDLHNADSNTIYLESVIHSQKEDQLSEAFSSIRQNLSKKQIMSSLQASIDLCDLLAKLSQKTLDRVIATPALQTSREMPPRLKQAVAYIYQHYTEAISLTDLAQHCSISKQQMIRYFNQVFHTTPNSYITDFKIARAKEYLFYHPDTSIKEIATELGFENQHYFARVFQKATGETPSQYRKRTIQYHNQNHY